MLLEPGNTVINQKELHQAFQDLAAVIPDPFELAGVTYHGPDAHRDWVAFVLNRETGVASGPEGWGNTPLEALDDLRSRLSEMG